MVVRHLVVDSDVVEGVVGVIEEHQVVVVVIVEAEAELMTDVVVVVVLIITEPINRILLG